MADAQLDSVPKSPPSKDEERPTNGTGSSTEPVRKSSPSPPPRRRIIENPDRQRYIEKSRSPSPRRRSPRRSPPRRNADWRSPRVNDTVPERYRERVRQARQREIEKADEAPKKQLDPAEEYLRLKELRSGGRYVPPAKLRALEAQLNLIKDPKEQQRSAWEELRKAINSLINKVNYINIKDIVHEIFTHNLVRGRGVFCRSIMKAQSIAQPFTPVYAALVAVINSKLPQVGELLVTRLIIQFRRSFKRNNKQACLSSAIFIAHLCNHQVAHEIVALEILFLLLGQPTDDSVEIAVAFTKEVGSYLAQASKAGSNGVFERFRAILHEGTLEKRTQYMIEVLFQVRKDDFKDNEIIPTDLDLVEEEDQITHMIGLDDELKGQDNLNIFRFDDEYEENENKYLQIKREILGDDESEEEENSDVEDSVSEAESEDEKAVTSGKPGDAPVVIKDMTNVELVTLRKTIYLTIMSSMSVDEATHKLFRITVPEGKEIEIVNMIIECCSQEKIYNKTYGGVAVRFCLKTKFWRDLYAQAFKHYYEVIHRYETNQIRNIATLFGYVLANDALSWEVFECVHMTEEDSTSSSRIFMKIMLQEMRQEMGLQEMVTRFKDEYIAPALSNMFPKAAAADTRFSINYFTAIGLGVLTEDMREYLQNLPPPSPVRRDSVSSRSRSGSVDSRSSYTSSRSRSSYGSRSRSVSPSRSRSRSRSSYSARSHSASPARGRRSRDRSYSRSPSRTRQPDTSNGELRKGRLVRGREMSSTRSVSNSSYSRSRSRSPYSRSRSYSSRSRSRTPRSRTPRSRTPQSRTPSRSVSPSRSRTPPRRRYRGSPSYSSRSRSVSRSRSRTPHSRSRSASADSQRFTSERKRKYSRSPPIKKEGQFNAGRPRHFSRSPPAKKERSVDTREKEEYSPPPLRPRTWAEAETLQKKLRESGGSATAAASGDSQTGDKRKERSESRPSRFDEDNKRRAKASDYL